MYLSLKSCLILYPPPSKKSNEGYVKTFLGLVKYGPQLVLNFRRKSTEGFAVGTMVFDLIGGAMALTQMLFIALNNDDLSGIYGNPGKFGTAVVTVAFESCFLLQRYFIYPKNARNGDKMNLIHIGYDSI